MPNAQGVAYKTPRGLMYEKYISSKAWERKRAAYWASAGRSCKVKGCGSTENLQVHHHTYERLGNEHLSDLVGVCKVHHDEIHARHDAGYRRESLTRVTERVTGLELTKPRPIDKPKTTAARARKKAVRTRKKAKQKRETLSQLEAFHLDYPPATPCSCRTCRPRQETKPVGKQVSVLDSVSFRERERLAREARPRKVLQTKKDKKVQREELVSRRAAQTRAHQQAQEVARRIATARLNGK